MRNILDTLQTIAENEPKIYDAGRQSQYDEFWDAFQNNGEIITDGSYAFSGSMWIDEVYNPKYPIRLNAFTNAFRGSSITDTKVTIDVSHGSGSHFFYFNNKISRIPKLIVNENNVWDQWFQNAVALKELYIEGVIGQNKTNLQWSPLTHDSLMSIINALKDYSNDTSGTTWKITLGSDNIAKLSAEEIQIIHDKGWEVE